MIISLSGKGGVGKTTITAILIDEILHHPPDCRLLVIDALDRQGGPLLAIWDDHLVRQALLPIIKRIGAWV